MEDIKRYTSKTYHDLEGFARTLFIEDDKGGWYKSADIDNLITDHKAVVKTMQKDIDESGDIIEKLIDNEAVLKMLIAKQLNKVEELKKENELLKCCGNCGHPERADDYCSYARTNVLKHHYCSNWTMYKILNTVQRGLNR